MKTFIDNSDLPITYSSVKTPLTIFQQGPIGVKDKMNWNGENVTQVEPFINAVDIDWNGANMGDEELNTTTDLLNYIKKNISQSLGLLKLSEDLQDIPDKDNSIIIYKDGQWLYDELGDLENIQGGTSSVISKTYEELTNLIANNNLVPGQQYMITDYQATVSGVEGAVAVTNTNSEFNIIVVADSKNTLNENARAVANTFSTSVCKAWKLKYSINNDKSRFSWADENGGKGVIYYMKDEWNNECPYDFKNIKFNGKFTFSNLFGNDASSYASCNNNIIRPFFETYTTIVDGISITSYRQTLNFIVIESATPALNIVIDGNNRNIVFKGRGNNVIVSYGTHTGDSIKEHTFNPGLENYWTVVGKESASDTIVEVCLLNLPDMLGIQDLITLFSTTLNNLQEQLGGSTLSIEDIVRGIINKWVLEQGGEGGEVTVISGTTLETTGDAKIKGDASIGGTLTVTGETTLNGKLTVDDDAEITGNTTLGGNLTATSGTTTLGVTNINGKLTVDNDAEITGHTTINTLEATSAEIENLDVEEKITTKDLKATGLSELTNLSSTNGNITHLISDDIQTKDLKVTDTADINNLKAKTIKSEDINTDYLTVNKSAYFFELIVDKVKSILGTQIISLANCIVDFVEAYTSTGLRCGLNAGNVGYYRIYWRNSDNDGKSIKNEWEPLDLAFCLSFNVNEGVNQNVSNKYYWRKVLAVSDNNNIKYVNFDRGIALSENRIYNLIEFRNGEDGNFSSFDILSENLGEWNGGYNIWTPTSTSFGLTLTPNILQSILLLKFSTDISTKLNIIVYYTDGTFDFVQNDLYQKIYSITSEKIIQVVKIYTKVIDKWYPCNWINILAVGDLGVSPNAASSIPSKGDNICQLGYRYNEISGYLNTAAWRDSHKSEIARSSAIIISSYKTPDSDVVPPSYALYLDITDFNLSSHRKSYFDATGAYFIGNFKVQSGSGDMNLDEYIRSLNTSEDTNEGIGIKVTLGEIDHSRLDYIILQADLSGNIYNINNFPDCINIQITYDGEPILLALYSELKINYLGKEFDVLDAEASLTPTGDGIYVYYKTYQSNEHRVYFLYNGTGSQTIDNSSLKISGKAEIEDLEYVVNYNIPISVVKSITGTDAEMWKLDKKLEVLYVDSNGLLLACLRYGVFHIIGSTTESVTFSENSDFTFHLIAFNSLNVSIRQSSNTPTAGSNYWEFFTENSPWSNLQDSNLTLYIKVELLKGEVIIDSTIVPVTLKPGYLFEVKEGLSRSILQTNNRIDDVNTHITTVENKYTKILQNYNDILLEAQRTTDLYNNLTGELNEIRSDYALFLVSAQEINSRLTTTETNFNTITTLVSTLTLSSNDLRAQFSTEIDNIKTLLNEFSFSSKGFDARIKDATDRVATLEGSVEGFKSTVSNTYVTKDDANDTYETIVNVDTKITQRADSILSLVGANYVTKTEAGNYVTLSLVLSEIKLKADEISLSVTALQQNLETLEENIQKTGIDIENGTITLNADNTVIGPNGIDGKFISDSSPAMNKLVIDSVNGGMKLYGPDSVDANGNPTQNAQQKLITDIGYGTDPDSSTRYGYAHFYDAKHPEYNAIIDNETLYITDPYNTVNIGSGGISWYDGENNGGGLEMGELIFRRMRVAHPNSDYHDAKLTDDMIISSYDGAITINLPNPNTCPGKHYFIKHKRDRNTNLTCSRAGYDAIMNDNSESTSSSCNVQNNSTLVFCDGEHWILMELDY